jgi:GntR family transcriptional regulator / MocR family aminotransferase
MTRAPVEFPLAIRPGGPVPMAVQVAAELRAAIADRRLAAGERLPASRALATSLGVSRTVVTSAYAQLFAEGWIEGRHGSGTFVAEGAPGAAGPPAGPVAPAWLGSPAGAGSHPGAGSPGRPGGYGVPTGYSAVTQHGVPAGYGAAAEEQGPPDSLGDLSSGVINLRPGIPWSAGIDAAAWRRAWRHAGHQVPRGMPATAGLPALRHALTVYLRRSRGVQCTASQILITRGVAGSLALLAAALLQPGDRVGVEEPGYPAARAVFAAHGARVVPCRVDQDGLVVNELPGGLRLVYTTPAHQYPLGGRLPVPRRQALIAWARATGALIVEDDYDGEFRYDVAPLPALFGLDPGVVAYLGTTSKTLTPSLATGWLVTSPGLAHQLAATADAVGGRAGEEGQRAVHALIAAGDLERHIRRMRHEYARRRAAVVGLLAQAAPGGLLGDTAGLHVVVALPPAQASRVAARAWQRGVAVGTLDRYWAATPARGGLVLGYGGACLADVVRGCEVLAAILPG